MYRINKIRTQQRKVVKKFSIKEQLERKYKPILENIYEEDIEGGRISLKKWINKNIEPVEIDLYGKIAKGK